MPTKAEQRKQKKRKARERRIRKMHNIARNNLGEPKYVLEVMLEGKWRFVREIRTWEGVLKHQTETEQERAAGKEILEGRIVGKESGTVKLSIPGSPSKGALPDKLAGSDSADKAVVDNKKELPDNLK